MAKVLVSIDDALLERIDAEARRLNLSRSAFISRLAERDMGDGKDRRSRMIEAVEEIRELVRKNGGWPEGETAESMIRQDRDSH